MEFVYPSFLLILPLMWGFIFLLYLIRSRPPLKPFPTLRFFKEIEPPSSSILRRKKPPRILQLLLDLLIVTLLLLSLSQPHIKVSLLPHLVLVVDNSLSLQAKDVSPSRWEALILEGEEILKKQRASNYSLVVGSPPYPSLYKAQHSSEILKVMKEVKPEAKHFLFEESLDVARVAGGEGALIYLLTDGSFYNQPEFNTTFLEGNSNYFQDVIIGSLPSKVRGGNVIFKRLILEERGEECYAFVSVLNDSADEALIKLTLTLAKPVISTDLILKAHEEKELFLKLPHPFPYLKGRVEVLEGTDFLTLDNEAYSAKGRNEALKIGLVGRENLFLRAALSSLKNEVEYTILKEEDIGLGGFDMYFLLGIRPSKLPFRPVVFFDLPSEGFKEKVLSQEEGMEFIKTEHPLLSYVEIEDLIVKNVVETVDSPSDKKEKRIKETILYVVYKGENIPLIYVEKNKPYHVVFTFSLDSSNLPLLPAFPILIKNIVSFLEEGKVNAFLGEEFKGEEVVVLTPQGKSEVADGEYVFRETGIYSLTTVYGTRYLAVNFPPGESDLKALVLTSTDKQLRPKLPLSLTPLFLVLTLILILSSTRLALPSPRQGGGKTNILSSLSGRR